MREKISVKYNGKEFGFFAVPNTSEEFLIKSEMANLLGGWDNLTQLDGTLDKFYNKHYELNSKRFGESEFSQKQSRLNELAQISPDKITEEEKKEFETLFSAINDNPHYLNYLKLFNDKSELRTTAELLVLSDGTPEDVELRELSAEDMEFLGKEAKKLFRPFRGKSTKT